jgi:hypothetical protein
MPTESIVYRLANELTSAVENAFTGRDASFLTEAEANDLWEKAVKLREALKQQEPNTQIRETGNQEPIHQSKTEERRVRLYEFLGAPAHLWLWLCARICGGQFSCGRVSSENH